MAFLFPDRLTKEAVFTTPLQPVRLLHQQMRIQPKKILFFSTDMVQTFRNMENYCSTGIHKAVQRICDYFLELTVSYRYVQYIGTIQNC